MVGAAFAVASGKEKLEYIDRHLNNKGNRGIISYKAPAEGLFLVDVEY